MHIKINMANKQKKKRKGKKFKRRKETAKSRVKLHEITL